MHTNIGRRNAVAYPLSEPVVELTRSVLQGRFHTEPPERFADRYRSKQTVEIILGAKEPNGDAEFLLNQLE
jgi:hypothetical protein